MAVVLVLLGVVLIVFSLYSITREIKEDSTDKKNFKAILQNKEENMTDVELLIGELRREFAETIIDLQKDIMEVKEQLSINDDENKLTVNNVNSVKINDVEKLLREGYSIEDISEKLEVGKGEILLIKELYLK